MASKEVAEPLVSVTILKYVMGHQPGEVIKVSAAQAEVLCKVSVVRDGEQFVEHRKAMLTSEAEKLKQTTVNVSKMTQHEMHMMGLKNVIPTPKDKGFEKFLKEKAKEPPLDEPMQEFSEKPIEASFSPGVNDAVEMHEKETAGEEPDPADFGVAKKKGK